MVKRTICLVGRPNTGKSTLFNRIVGKKVAIIEDSPGVTRDRIYSSATYKDIPFYLIDTGGIDLSDGDFNEEIRMQVEIGILESDIIVFVVDSKDGITNQDELIRDMLKKTNKKVIVAINKVDNKTGLENSYEFYSLGFDNYVNISAEHGTGINDLLKLITEGLEPGYEEEDNNIKISVIGRPNVGKSSLVNALLNDVAVPKRTTRKAAVLQSLLRPKNLLILARAAALRSLRRLENRLVLAIAAVRHRRVRQRPALAPAAL